MKIILFITTIINFILLYKISKIKSKNVLGYYVVYCIGGIFISNLGTFLQYLLSNTYRINVLARLEPLISFPILIVCTLFLLLSITFTNIKKTNSAVSILFLIPIICGFLILTNDLHNLVFENYSLNCSDIVYGPVYYIMLAYCMICLLFSYILYITILTKENNEFATTANYIYLYTMIPITVYLLDLFYNIGLSRGFLPILCTPISFILANTIYREKTINILKIANADLFSKMPNSYIVLDYNKNIIEDNYKFDTKFGIENESKNITNFSEKMALWNKNKLISNILFNEIIYKLTDIKVNHRKASLEFVVRYNLDDYYFCLDMVPIISELRKKYVGCLITITDISKQKMELLTIAEDQEMIINQQHLATIGELTSGFAHDINTPLSAIQTALSIIKYNPKLDSTGKSTVLAMEKSINEISNFSSNVRNQLRNMDSITTTKFSINTAIYNIIELSKTEAEKNKCKIVFDLKKTIYLEGNSSKFSQVISNLLINAIQAYDSDGGEIIIDVKKTSKNVQITITDHAYGLPENIQFNIFKKILATNKENGNGLGLYISHSIIKSDFNGNITFVSKPNSGTTFKITIPISKEVK